ncbi:MAG: RNA polymerase subunit sigma [Rhodovulum sulfidophilum]|uniref:RNA polymerase subunit sigma n=1 Tax=Rhodovulum sulfidophilum TaxID=35806 RepID=A0A2W5N3A0_RHOSU|nr:MAG: RNA polymerase subunit sigma [Rhodovulum sulfidophilum]
MTRDAPPIADHLPALRRFALALTRDADRAEDLVQEALLRGHERRHSHRRSGSLKSWLFSILRNAFIDHRRGRLAEARREGEIANLAPISIDAPQEAVVRLGQVRVAFLALPEDQRRALSLIALEGLSYAEAARVADVPIGTLMSRVARARAGLRAFEEGAPVARGLRVVGGRDATRG